jgi:hypothetical protein
MSNGSGRFGPAVRRATLVLLGLAWLSGCNDTPEGTIKLKGTREEQADRMINPYGNKTKVNEKKPRGRGPGQYDLSKSIKNRPMANPIP